MKRADLIRMMHRAGIPPMYAETASRIAMQAVIRERDSLIASLIHNTGVSLRAAGVVFGMSHEGVRKASRRGASTRARGELTATAHNIKA